MFKSQRQSEGVPFQEPSRIVPAPTFLARAGSVTGVQHTRKGVNNQDSFVLRTLEVNNQHYTIGIVSDGCTGKTKRSRTEIGSGLLTLYAFSEIRSLLALNVPPQEIPGALHPRCVSYVGNLARLTISGTVQEMCSFIENMFLCTLLGFIKSEKELVTFQSGDGFMVVNDQVLIADQNDRPTYLAYHQFDRSLLGDYLDSLPQSFETNVYDVSYLDRFALGTDGLVRRRDDTRQLFIEPAELEGLFSHSPGAPAGLQWWLNKQQNRHSRFDDDTTLITLNKTPESPAEPGEESES